MLIRLLSLLTGLLSLLIRLLSLLTRLLSLLTRLLSEQKAAERQKLKQDLNEANARISLLVKEGDDRQTALERLKEHELRCVADVTT